MSPQQNTQAHLLASLLLSSVGFPRTTETNFYLHIAIFTIHQVVLISTFHVRPCPAHYAQYQSSPSQLTLVYALVKSPCITRYRVGSPPPQPFFLRIFFALCIPFPCEELCICRLHNCIFFLPPNILQSRRNCCIFAALNIHYLVTLVATHLFKFFSKYS